MLQYAKGTDSSRDTLSSVGKFRHYVNNAISSHLRVRDIDMALLSGDFESLMEINKVDNFDALLSNSVESS